MTTQDTTEQRDTYTLLVDLRDMIERAGTLPLSSSPKVNRDDVLAYLDEAIAQMPEEFRAARRLLKEREEYLAKMKRDGQEILETARERAAAMVEKEAVTRRAKKEARRVYEEAEEKARQLRHEADDYVDQKLAAFEVVLERIMGSVAKGRDRLQVHVTTPTIADEGEEPETAFFDQDD